MPDEQFFSYMMARTSYICFVLDQHAKLDFNSASSLKQVCGQTCHSTQTRFPESEPTSLYSYSFMLHVQRRTSKYQIYSLFFNLTWARTHDLPHSVYARPWCQYIKARLKNISVCPNPTHHSEVWVGRQGNSLFFSTLKEKKGGQNYCTL